MENKTIHYFCRDNLYVRYHTGHDIKIFIYKYKNILLRKKTYVVTIFIIFFCFIQHKYFINIHQNKFNSISRVQKSLLVV